MFWKSQSYKDEQTTGCPELGIVEGRGGSVGHERGIFVVMG